MILNNIPDGWKLVQVSDVFDFSGGSQPPRSTFEFVSREGLIRLLQIRDYKSDKYQTFIPSNLAKKTCDESDIMIGRYGPPIFQILRGLSGAYNVALIKAIPKGINKDYAYHFLTQRTLFDFVEKLSQRSSGQTGVDLNQLKNYQFLIPVSQGEQKAIANALTDVDALIDSLDQLIAKKKAIKKGVMQQLLTPPHKGGKRLPGFEGEWERITLGERAQFLKGKGLPKSALNIDGEFPCIHYGQLFTVYGELIQNVVSRTSQHENAVLSMVNDVLMPTSDVTPNGLATASALYQENVILGGDILVIRPSAKMDANFLSYMVGNEKHQIMTLVSGTTVYHLYGSDMANFRFWCPMHDEQVAIAETINDFESELKSLIERKNKYVEIKQGMMQELLTGKTRLI